MDRKNCRQTQLICYALLLTATMHLVFMAFSGKGLLSENPYNSYARQAAAWLTGHLELPENCEWLELAVYQQKYYVSFPPFPSYLLLPFSLFFGIHTPDHLIAFAILLVGVAYGVKISCFSKLKERYCVLFPVFLYCGNNLWQITVDGWVWFFAQSLSFTLTLMAFYYALIEKKGRSLFFLCASVGCRPFQLLYLPLVCWLLLRKAEGSSWQEKWKACFFSKAYQYFPAVLLAFSYLSLNFLRFGNPLEFGHNFLPEFTRSPQGQFSFSYLSDNLQKLFRLPSLEEGRLIFPEFDGSNLFLVYPIFLFYLFLLLKMAYFSLKNKNSLHEAVFFNLLSFSILVFHVLLLAMHKTMGGAHFGNRYVADLIPAVYLSIAGSLPACFYTENLSEIPDTFSATELLFYLCFFWGLLLNFTGVLDYYT